MIDNVTKQLIEKLKQLSDAGKVISKQFLQKHFEINERLYDLSLSNVILNAEDDDLLRHFEKFREQYLTKIDELCKTNHLHVRKLSQQDKCVITSLSTNAIVSREENAYFALQKLFTEALAVQERYSNALKLVTETSDFDSIISQLLYYNEKSSQSTIVNVIRQVMELINFMQEELRELSMCSEVLDDNEYLLTDQLDQWNHYLEAQKELENE
jgi:hypothetical protein